MHRILIVGLVACTGLAGWISPAAAAPVSNAAPVNESAAADPLSQAAPDALLRAVTLRVTAQLKQDRNLQTTSPAKFAELIESTILPLFDFRHMTQLALARNWRIASPEQQNELVTEFRTLLVRAYSTALANYRDQAIEYKPLRMAPGDTEVVVKSTVNQRGTEPMTLDYDMEKTTTGWKVYDIKIAGMSLITTYQSTFDQIIRDGGVDRLIQSISSKNRQAESGIRSHESASRHLVLMHALVPGFLGKGR